MGIRELNAAILQELRKVINKSTIRQRDIIAWNTSEEIVKKDAKPGETIFYLPDLRVYVAVKIEKKK